MKRRRRNYVEPVHCVCEPGGKSHPAHHRPGNKAPAHLNPECPHSTLGDTTKPAPKPKPKRRKDLRIDL